MLTESYKGRHVAVGEVISHDDPTGRRKHYISVTVNGAKQFSYNRFTEPAWAMEQTRRYIDAVDAAADKARHKAQAVWSQTDFDRDPESETFGQLVTVGGYGLERNSDFADSWRAAA